MRSLIFILASFGLITLTWATNALAQIHTETVDYKQGNTVLEGYLAYDSTSTARRPGILIIHQWKGITDYEKMRAQMLAQMGYVAFAADIYGKGIRPQTNEEAGAQAGNYYKDRQLLRARAQAGLEQLKKSKFIDTTRVAVIGYCFGGSTALELARSGVQISGAVSFHGILSTPTPDDANNIKGKILVLTGAIDPNVPPDQVKAFEDEMSKAGVDWQLISYGGAVHSFTIPTAGSDISTGSAYNEKADKRSWEAMKQFFAEIFRGK
jgi:dienelactone hydrolase